MEILITSKTHKGNAACVGGMIIENNRLVRLLNEGNWDQYSNTEFDVGDIWDIDFRVREDVIPPHIEDVIIRSESYVRNIGSISEYILESGVTIYNGSPTAIFNGALNWTSNGSGYIWNRDRLPCNSVGFWISDQDLEFKGKHYEYPPPNDFSSSKRLPYVGFAPAIATIPAGTLMRISLARWWKPDDSDISERCYLQLSGWYDIDDPPMDYNRSGNAEDDLPF